jgi:DNA invertase Pin-like site-specific DNA recombinase
MLAIFAEFEHDTLRDRVKACIAQRAKKDFAPVAH